MPRCPWTGDRPLDNHYHDTEWGVPCFSDAVLFEYLVLDSFQAGVSWWLILSKRENFRRAFDQFTPEIIATYGPADVERLLHDAGIIRNRAKIEATIRNAQLYLELRAQTTLSDYLWRYIDGQPIVNRHTELTQVPQYTPLAETMSKDLRKRGFKFMGPTTVYAFLQAAGLVNDHLMSCERWAQVQTLRR